MFSADQLTPSQFINGQCGRESNGLPLGRSTPRF
jgi:hypothetical protein